MAHNIPLEILDEYAKVLTKKQANMLYEAKTHTKYVKALNESMQYQNDDNYSIYLDEYTLNCAKMNTDKVLARYVSKHSLQYNVVNEGVYLYTPFISDYNALMEDLVSDGISKQILIDNTKDVSLKKYIQNI